MCFHRQVARDFCLKALARAWHGGDALERSNHEAAPLHRKLVRCGRPGGASHFVAHGRVHGAREAVPRSDGLDQGGEPLFFFPFLFGRSNETSRSSCARMFAVSALGSKVWWRLRLAQQWAPTFSCDGFVEDLKAFPPKTERRLFQVLRFSSLRGVFFASIYVEPSGSSLLTVDGTK